MTGPVRDRFEKLAKLPAGRCQAVGCRHESAREVTIALYGLIAFEIKVRFCTFHADQLEGSGG
jgi:hypothetical protein